MLLETTKSNVIPMSNIKYVELEVVNTQGKLSLTKGLFYGMHIKESLQVVAGVEQKKIDYELIRLFLNDNTSIFVNPSCYDVISTATVHLDGKRKQVFFKKGVAEQRLAIMKVKEIVLQLRTQGLCNGEMHVDVKKYRDIPSDYTLTRVAGETQGLSLEAIKRINASKDVKDKSVVTTGSNAQTKQIAKPIITPAEDPVFFMKRKTKKPTPAALKLMRSKVVQIADGTYEGPLPKVKGEDGENKEKKSSEPTEKEKADQTAQAFMDYYNDIGDNGGMMH